MTVVNRAVLETAADAARSGAAACLALVVETEGSTYVRAGAMALFDADGPRCGWLSGGCLEPEIARRAGEAIAAAHVDALEIDTREDEDLLAPSAIGCRGRLHLLLLPLSVLDGIGPEIEDWLARVRTLRLTLAADGLQLEGGSTPRRWPLACTPAASALLRVPRAFDVGAVPRVLVLGAGPESALLLPLLRRLGWKTLLAERRTRWTEAAKDADRHLPLTPTDAVAEPEAASARAVLVMHHHFELDREALVALASHAAPYVGLLGPRRRQEDLFRLLPDAVRHALAPRLRSPVGLRLGGQGAEAIALSIAAELQRIAQEE